MAHRPVLQSQNHRIWWHNHRLHQSTISSLVSNHDALLSFHSNTANSQTSCYRESAHHSQCNWDKREGAEVWRGLEHCCTLLHRHWRTSSLEGRTLRHFSGPRHNGSLCRQWHKIPLQPGIQLKHLLKCYILTPFLKLGKFNSNQNLLHIQCQEKLLYFRIPIVPVL